MTDSKTATERLRELLDELGVEWCETRSNVGCVFTHYNSELFGDIAAMDNGAGYLYFGELNGICITPEQAIAATLGNELNLDGLPVGLTISEDGNLLNWRGENYVRQSTLCGGRLTAEQVEETVEKHWHDLPDEYDMPEATALLEYSYNWQAIADELNAALGAGKCERVLYKPTGVLVCSECGAGMPKQLDKYCYLRYCPNCGRAVNYD